VRPGADCEAAAAGGRILGAGERCRCVRPGAGGGGGGGGGECGVAPLPRASARRARRLVEATRRRPCARASWTRCALRAAGTSDWAAGAARLVRWVAGRRSSLLGCPRRGCRHPSLLPPRALPGRAARRPGIPAATPVPVAPHGPTVWAA
jgi:hypothetical protein